jgi:hypothetical protein
VKTDIEELLPISQRVKSLPRPPRLPTFEAPQLPPPTTRRFPWMSLSIFAVVLGASLAPLARYRVERSTASATGELNALREVDWASLAPLPRERALWSEPTALRDALLDDAERALSAEDASAAESAFVRAMSFGGEDPSAAFGLARVRLARGDVPGARAWAESALRRKPNDPRYRTFSNQLTKQRRSR